MKRDLKRHNLLRILAAKRVKFEANTLSEGEHIGVSFEELTIKMNCDILILNFIASELYDNEEIKHHNVDNINGLYCGKYGLTSFANNKYKSRYWRDIWTNFFTISQIIVPILALVVALVAVLDSRQNTANTNEIQLLKKEVHELREQINFRIDTVTNQQNSLKFNAVKSYLNKRE